MVICRRGFFLIELMVGFILVQIVLAVAGGYITHQARSYRTSVERLQALDAMCMLVEASWPLQSIASSGEIGPYTYTYQSVSLPSHKDFIYGLVTITYQSHGNSQEITIPLGNANMEML